MKKIFNIIGIILSILIIVFSILHLAGIVSNAIDVAMPLLGLLMFIQALENYKNNKILSIFSFLVGLFIFIVAVVKYI